MCGFCGFVFVFVLLSFFFFFFFVLLVPFEFIRLSDCKAGAFAVASRLGCALPRCKLLERLARTSGCPHQSRYRRIVLSKLLKTKERKKERKERIPKDANAFFFFFLSYFSQVAVRLSDGNILFCGGATTGSVYVAPCYLLDTAAGTWSNPASFSVARGLYMVVPYANATKVLFCGGYSGSVVLSSCDIYDVGLRTMTSSGNSMLTARWLGGADGEVGTQSAVFCGGLTASTETALCDRFDGGTFSAFPSLNVARQRMTLTSIGGGSFVACGGSNELATVRQRSCEKYTVATNVFTLNNNSMSVVRSDHTANLLNDGNILLCGGDTSENVATDLCDVLSPSSMSVLYSLRMSTGRFRHTSVKLPNGDVMICGGTNGVSSLSSCELFDSTTKLLRVLSGNLVSPKNRHAMERSNSGTAYVVGGSDGTAISSSAQAFTMGAANSITFLSPAPSNAVVSGSPYVASASAASGGTVVISTSTSSVCVGNTTSIQFVGVGTCSVVATHFGDSTFSSAQRIQTFTVGRGSQTISFGTVAPANPSSGSTYVVTATATSGFAVTISISPASAAQCSISGAVVTFLSAGTCTILANQAGNVNFNAAPQVLFLAYFPIVDRN